jgi:outer membrane autotransporter protein
VMADVFNDGIIAPGGRGTVETTALTGTITQSASGVLAIDVGGSTSDLIEVSEFADLAGKVAVTLTSLPTSVAQSYLVLEALGGVTDNGLGLIASPALHATLFTDATNVMLGIQVDFIVDSLNPNQRAIAENLGHIFVGGVGTLGPALLGLLNVGSVDDFKNALDQLSPEIYSDAEIAALYSSLAFSNSLLSCKVNGTDTASIIREGQCLWAGASARFLDSGTTSDQIGFNETAGLFTAGAQVALDDVWRLGAAAGYQSSTLQTATGAESEGSLAQAGVSLKYNPGPLLLAGALTGGGAWYDTTRPMAFGGFTGLAEGDQDLGIFSVTFRAAYVLGTPHLYFKPILDANLTHLELGGFTESGGNGAALAVDGAGHTVFSLAPMLETGTEWWLGNGTLVRPLIRVGAIWYEGADFATTASFAGAPLGVSAFTINTDIDEVMGLIGAGVEVINGGDAALRLSYDGQLGADTQIHSVGIKGSSKF